jgi:hypothetical protein
MTSFSHIVFAFSSKSKPKNFDVFDKMSVLRRTLEREGYCNFESDNDKQK